LRRRDHQFKMRDARRAPSWRIPVILLARHGETEFNLQRRAQGVADSPLTPLGLRQAHAMASLVADLVAREPGVWRMVSSPLGRAVATAKVFSEHVGLPFDLDHRLREHSMGEFDGLHVDEFVPLLRTDVPPHERSFHTPGGESFETLSARIGEFLGEAGPEDRVIVVSHGAAGRVIRGLLGGLDRKAMLTLEVPQDAIFRLHDGQIDRFDCEPFV
jgi:probable phosphoglycerate mutase